MGEHGLESMDLIYRSKTSTDKSERFQRSLSQPGNFNSMSQPTTPTLSLTSAPHRKNSGLSTRSNSIGAIINFNNGAHSRQTSGWGEISLSKKFKRKFSSTANSVLSVSDTASASLQVAAHTRSRSNSLRKSLDSPSSVHNSPIFNTNSFSDITEDYFKYSKRRNRSTASSSNESHFLSLRTTYSNDPLDTASSTNYGEEVDSVYSSISFVPDSTLGDPIHEVADPSPEDVDHEREDELAESMAFGILQKIKEISLREGNDELSPGAL